MNKRTVSAELAYLLAILLLALAVAILTSADFGLSMVVAPAYLLSRKLGVITFGQAEYIVQAVLFAVLCCVLRRFKPVYLASFVTGLIYGRVLDFWRSLPCFDTSVTMPESIPLWLRVLMLIGGILLTSFSIALFFKTYLYPQVYDFFVKAVSMKYGVRLSAFKTGFDLSFLVLSVVLTFCFFGRFAGVGWATLVMALINGSIIGFFSKLLDKYFAFTPRFPKFAAQFSLEQKE